MDGPERIRCANCKAELSGEYCAVCGQAARDYDVPISTFARDMVSESLDLDSRLRNTMGPLFFRPGLVPRGYVAGHRARFVPPFRLYLLASFAMFLLMSLGSGINVQGGEGARFEVDLTGGRAGAAAGSRAGAAVDGAADSADAPAAVADGQENPEGAPSASAPADAAPAGAEPLDSAEEARLQRLTELEDRIETRLSEGVARAAEDPAAFAEEFSNRMAQAMFLLLPLFALLLKLHYPKRLYVHHLVFALYFHSWFFMVVAVTLVPGALGFTRVSDVAAIVLLWAPVYLFLALRRFFGESRVRTALKVFVLSNVYLLLASVAMLGAIFMSITSD